MAAEGAIVIEEFNHTHVAIWISRHMGYRRSKNGIGIVGDGLCLLWGLALVELGRHFDQDLRVLSEVVAHDPLDPLLIHRDRRVSEYEIARPGRRHRGHDYSHNHIKKVLVEIHALE
jgi:hypothetical protein